MSCGLGRLFRKHHRTLIYSFSGVKFLGSDSGKKNTGPSGRCHENSKGQRVGWNPAQHGSFSWCDKTLWPKQPKRGRRNWFRLAQGSRHSPSPEGSLRDRNLRQPLNVTVEVQNSTSGSAHVHHLHSPGSQLGKGPPVFIVGFPLSINLIKIIP